MIFDQVLCLMCINVVSFIKFVLISSCYLLQSQLKIIHEMLHIYLSYLTIGKMSLVTSIIILNNRICFNYIHMRKKLNQILSPIQKSVYLIVPNQRYFIFYHDVSYSPSCLKHVTKILHNTIHRWLHFDTMSILLKNAFQFILKHVGLVYSSIMFCSFFICIA